MIANVRERMHREAFGRVVYKSGRICPTCRCQAKANRTTQTHTYYYFECGAPSYKQPRSQTAIALLRQGPETARVGCDEYVPIAAASNS